MNLKKIISSAALMGLVACSPVKQEHYSGNFNGNPVEISRKTDGSDVRLVIHGRDYNALPIDMDNLIAYDSAGDGVFEQVFLNGRDLKKVKANDKNLTDNRLYGFSNQGSLRAAYNTVVLQQNKPKETK